VRGAVRGHRGPHRLGAELAAFLVAGAAMLALAVIDLDLKRLPDLILLPTSVATTVLLIVAAAVDDDWGGLGRAVLGGALGFAVLLAIHLVRPDGLGFGDVKLAYLCGLLLGWWGLADVVLGLYGGFFLGAVIGVAFDRVGTREVRPRHPVRSVPRRGYLGDGAGGITARRRGARSVRHSGRPGGVRVG